MDERGNMWAGLKQVADDEKTRASGASSLNQVSVFEEKLTKSRGGKKLYLSEFQLTPYYKCQPLLLLPPSLNLAFKYIFGTRKEHQVIWRQFSHGFLITSSPALVSIVLCIYANVHIIE